jgi:hypothetical protein
MLLLTMSMSIMRDYTLYTQFSELETDLELLGSRRNADLMEDQVDALWTQVRPASDSLTSHVLPSVAHNTPDGVGEW